ncbi:MAG: ATP-binding protein [Candidatus Cyclobacteriaceae bacterium M3_2C_046]
MEKLFIKHRNKVAITPDTFVRSIMDKIHWQDRLIGLKGGRGVGKTTLLLQYIKKHLPPGSDNLYVSLDDVYFAGNSLTDFVEEFVKNGGQYLFLDEVHRYDKWSQSLKNIYDDYPKLKVVFTGSSVLDIIQSQADLSRRAIIYKMKGLSFREYLALTDKLQWVELSLNEILANHETISMEIATKIKPVKEFKEYLKSGYYPFFQEYPQTYQQRLEQVINLVLENDITALKPVNLEGVKKLKQLLYVLSTSVPFKPNISKLAEKTGISRNSLVQYLHYLHEAEILHLLFRDTGGVSLLQKPEKIYFENPNLVYTLGIENTEPGNLRETFFINQVATKHQLTYTEKGDFKVDDHYTFEIGGKNKNQSQLKNIDNAWLALDDIEYGYKNKIPLWLFGFLY